ncbi:thioredoxin family protein [uncultured Sphingomonas sp.]|uniref:DUF1223 domain-containing protein n=1 Tax=uncultured Sphingomonas sp. TaxID=158754 RepID=UPI00260C397C|nr:DUF1223 domain-containing protein [uncultured Sphingomonas sp.]
MHRLWLAGIGLSLSASAPVPRPVVVELFTAQGCAACPPAQAVVNALADRPDVIALSFSVTYWDALGWRDRFGQPAFTERQRRYAIVGHRQLATPQVLVNGRIAITGRDPAETARAIRNAEPADPGPSIRQSGATLTIGADRRTARPATLWLVDYDPRTLSVPIGAGENIGRTLPHRNVVRGLRAIGRWGGDAVRIALPPASRWRRVVLLQAADGGSIVAAARLS